MKLRIRGDSIRLRLTRGEVQELVSRGAVAELTRLPAGPGFGYQLRAAAFGTATPSTPASKVAVTARAEASVRSW